MLKLSLASIGLIKIISLTISPIQSDKSYILCYFSVLISVLCLYLCIWRIRHDLSIRVEMVTWGIDSCSFSQGLPSENLPPYRQTRMDSMSPMTQSTKIHVKIKEKLCLLELWSLWCRSGEQPTPQHYLHVRNNTSYMKVT